MTKAEQYEEIILQTNEWFDSKIQQLQLLIDSQKDRKIFFEGKDGEQVALPNEHKKGFLMGIQIAIETMGKFPVKIAKK